MNSRVLMIEDNERNQYLQKYLLEARGWQVTVAGNGVEGLRLAEQIHPGLIVLDIQLPGMDGYEVAGALREIKGLDQVPIVAVTSYAMAGDREKCIAAGCTGYIEKPIDPERFAEQVERYMEASR